MDKGKRAANTSSPWTKLGLLGWTVLLQIALLEPAHAQQSATAMVSDKPPLKSSATSPVKSADAIPTKTKAPSRKPASISRKQPKEQPRDQAVVNPCGDTKPLGREMAPAGSLLKSVGPEWSRIELIRDLFSEYSQRHWPCATDLNLQLALYINAQDQLARGSEEKWEAPGNKSRHSANTWSAFEDDRPERHDGTTHPKRFIDRTTPLRFYGSRFLGVESSQSRFQRAAYPADGNASLEQIFDDMKKNASGREERNQLENRLRVLEGYLKLVELVYVPRVEKVPSRDPKLCYRAYSLTLVPSRIFEEAPASPANRAKLTTGSDLRSKKEKLERLARGQGLGDSWAERITGERDENCADSATSPYATELSDAAQASYHKDAIDAVTITMRLTESLGDDFWKACEEFWAEVGKRIERLSDNPE